MISNDRPSPYGKRSHGPPKPRVEEDTIRSEKIQIERKSFLLALKENARGRFLRITEDVGGRRDTIKHRRHGQVRTFTDRAGARAWRRNGRNHEGEGQHDQHKKRRANATRQD